MSAAWSSLDVLLANELSDGLQLDVARALVYGADLGVAVVLLSSELLSEADPSQPVDTLRRHTLRHLRGLQLGHRGLLHEGKAVLLQTGGVVDEDPGGLDLHGGARVLELHTLEV